MQIRDLIVIQEPARGGAECPTAQERICNTPGCPSRMPTHSPTLSPTAAPTGPPTPAATIGIHRPVIEVRGTDIVTVEADRSTRFTDPGATCFDPTDGNLTSKIQSEYAFVVSTSAGNVTTYLRAPKLSVPGVYEATYQCKNMRGVQAIAARKVVVVRDSTCPTCVISTGAATVEASFPYADPGAVCTDNIDGAKPQAAIEVTGTVDVEATGTYTLTYRVEDAAGNWNDGVCAGSQRYVRTVKVVDTLRPVIGLRYQNKLVHVSDASESSTTDSAVTNPARTYFSSDRSLMMEHTPLDSGAATNFLFAGVAALVALGVVLARRSSSSTSSSRSGDPNTEHRHYGAVAV
jgi:hypothetical protein